jgi:sulfur-oxidizing protein SoxA
MPENSMMRKFLASLTLIAFTVGLIATAQASPESDLAEFQSFFKKKFPDVPVADFSNGVYAVNKELRAEWEKIMEFPPYELGLENGKKIWATPFKNGKTFAGCFKRQGKNIAQHYPYWDEDTKQVKTLEMEINECLRRNGEPQFKDLEKGGLAEVTAYMKSLSRGKKVEIDLSRPGAIEAYEKGKQYYWSRRGQLNFACAHCHIESSGGKIRGNVLSPGLGHGVGWPAYRSDWGQISTLHRRYAGCNAQIRAKPLPPQSETYRNLELYETYMNTGLPLVAPSQRY